MTPVSRGNDRVKVVFDEPGLVADAGLILIATLVSRLGLEALINDVVCFADRKGGFRPGMGRGGTANSPRTGPSMARQPPHCTADRDSAQARASICRPGPVSVAFRGLCPCLNFVV